MTRYVARRLITNLRVGRGGIWSYRRNVLGRTGSSILVRTAREYRLISGACTLEPEFFIEFESERRSPVGCSESISNFDILPARKIGVTTDESRLSPERR